MWKRFLVAALAASAIITVLAIGDHHSGAASRHFGATAAMAAGQSIWVGALGACDQVGGPALLIVDCSRYANNSWNIVIGFNQTPANYPCCWVWQHPKASGYSGFSCTVGAPGSCVAPQPANT